MKTIRTLNSLVVGLSIFCISLSAIESDFVFLAMFSLLFTGVMQLFLAIILLYFVKNYRYLLLYFLMTAAYFLFAPYLKNFISWEYLIIYVLGVPAIIATYLSILIYSEE